MTIQFNKETFRDDYSFKNSDWAIQRFPFPFHEDSYMYSVNMEQHRGGPAGSVYEKRFDVDEHYISEMEDRAMVLADDPLRVSITASHDIGWMGSIGIDNGVQVRRLSRLVRITS